jgi:ATP-dependent DNA ligase
MLWRSSAHARRPEGFIEPCLPTLGDTVPTGPQWAYEIKHDGYRFCLPALIDGLPIH